MNFLADRDVGSFAMYPTPVPLLPCYADLAYKPEDIPVAAEYADRVVNLPIFPHLREDEVLTAAQAVVISIKASIRESMTELIKLAVLGGSGVAPPN